jgi:hypothetical protein
VQPSEVILLPQQQTKKTRGVFVSVRLINEKFQIKNSAWRENWDIRAGRILAVYYKVSKTLKNYA